MTTATKDIVMTRSHWEQLDAQFIQLIQADGYNIHLHEGQMRLRQMRQAWRFAQQRAKKLEWITPLDIKEIAYLIEPVKNLTFRRMQREPGLPPEQIYLAICLLAQRRPTTPQQITDFLDRFVEIDPFVEGTARIAYVLRGWLETVCQIHNP